VGNENLEIVMKDEYKRIEVQQSTGLPARRIQFYVDSGLVVPDIRGPSGKGRSMIFSGRNLIEFGMIQVLQEDLGLSLQSIREILNGLREGKSSVEDMTMVKFHDFFTSDRYGRDIELIYVEITRIDGVSFGLFSKGETKDFPYPPPTILSRASMTLVPLGLVKIRAMNKLGG